MAGSMIRPSETVAKTGMGEQFLRPISVPAVNPNLLFGLPIPRDSIA